MEAEDVQNISFEERQRMQTRVQIVKKKATTATASKPREEFKKKKTKREKGRPVEMSSKHPAPLPTATPPPSRRVSQRHQTEARDPRFDNLSGQFNARQFAEDYSFLDGVRAKEMKKLNKIARRTKNPATKEKVQQVLRREADKKRELERAKKRDEERERRRNEAVDRLQQGKPAQFRSRTENKLDELVQRYDELKNKGKLQNYIKKKLKRKPRPDTF